MSATASASAGCVRQTTGFFQPASVSVAKWPSPFSLCPSTSFIPQIADSSSFPASEHFATFLPDTYLSQDQYLLSSAGADIPDVTQSAICLDLYDDSSEAFLSTEDLDFINIGNQLLVPSVDNSPAHTLTSKEDSSHSMKDCDDYLLNAPLVGNAEDSFTEVNKLPTTNSGRSSPTRPYPLSSTVPDGGHSPGSSSSSATKSTGSRKRQRADDAKRSEEEIANEKRQRNTMAARRFRKRKEDRISSLEKQLADALRERDELKLQVARLEGQNMMLRKCQ